SSGWVASCCGSPRTRSSTSATSTGPVSGASTSCARCAATPTASAGSAPDRSSRGRAVASAAVDRTGDLTRPHEPGDHLGAGVDHGRVVVLDARQDVPAPPFPPLRAAVEGPLPLVPLGQRAERPHEVVVLRAL